MNKKTTVIIIIVALIILLILPFGIEWLLYNTSILPFDITSKFSYEVWFGFIGSYLGAIGTIILSSVALFQNKKYKELSDQTETQALSLQNEIKQLNEKIVELIEINTKLEVAKYHPVLTDMRQIYWNTSFSKLDEWLDISNGSFQITYSFLQTEFPISIPEIFKNHKTLTITLKNDGVTAIKNLQCYKLITNDNPDELKSNVFQSCDVESGGILYLVYATHFDLAEKIKTGQIHSLHFYYHAQNIIAESFLFEVRIDYAVIENDEIVDMMYISPFTKGQPDYF